MIDQNLLRKDPTYVEKMLKLRMVTDGEFQILVHWQGFQKDEASWELLSQMVEDMPQMTMEFLRKLAKRGNTKAEDALRSLE